ncbi:MAG: metallophosphoesterase [Clostridiales bacterium]|nr:metallophosphoesterase [Clostridiales bacterium]
MKLLIFSDSHGNKTNMKKVLEQEQPDMVFHLGDGRGDILAVLADHPEIELHSVAGNCDWRSRCRTEELVTVCGLRIFLTHGHEYTVKSGYSRLIAAGRRQEADIVLVGHTHISCVRQESGILLINPGAVGNSPHPSYAVLEAEDGILTRCEIARCRIRCTSGERALFLEDRIVLPPFAGIIETAELE